MTRQNRSSLRALEDARSLSAELAAQPIYSPAQIPPRMPPAVVATSSHVLDTRPPLDRFIAALEAAGCRPYEKSHGRWRAFCPYCGGGKSGRDSLKVCEGHTVAVVFNCFRCGDTEAIRSAILETIGLTWDDLSPFGPQLSPAVRLELALFLRAIDRATRGGAFAGPIGESQRLVLLALAGYVLKSKSMVVSGSVRQLAEDSGRGRKAVSLALRGRRPKPAQINDLSQVTRRAVTARDGLPWLGWLRVVKGHGIVAEAVEIDEHPGIVAECHGRTWALRIPPEWRENGQRDSIQPCDGHLEWGRSDHFVASLPGDDAGRAFGGSAGRSLDVILDWPDNVPLTVADMAKAHGLPRRTTQRHIDAFLDAGVVVCTQSGGKGRGKSAVYALAPGVTRKSVPWRVGSVGAHEAACRAHEAERRQWLRRVEERVSKARPQTVDAEGVLSEGIPPGARLDWGSALWVAERDTAGPNKTPAIDPATKQRQQPASVTSSRADGGQPAGGRILTRGAR